MGKMQLSPVRTAFQKLNNFTLSPIKIGHFAENGYKHIVHFAENVVKRGYVIEIVAIKMGPFSPINFF